MKNKPELLLPAGSFASAVYAFKNGADAVYLGLKDFSARKAAVNFSFKELRRLKRYSIDNGKKIYVTINTIITEKELLSLHTTLGKLSVLEIDGIIIQDPGMTQFIKKHFPSITVHASTQMGIHNPHAAVYAAAEGIGRIILSRELSVSEIKKIKEAVPETEIEVFIHGALCYSFSGLCLASGKLLGRSANRGECAQICRTWFEGGGRKGYFFSMKDLSAYRKLKELEDAGVSSFKIEGRMKSPEYTGLTAELYKNLVDGNIDSTLWEKASKPSRTVFSRPFTDSWINGNFKSQVTFSTYPSHLGVEAGTVIAADGRSFTIKLSDDIAVRDGLMFLDNKTPPKPHNFSLTLMKNSRGKRITEASKGEIVTIYTSDIPEKDSAVYKTSSHDLNWPAINERSFPVWKNNLEIQITLSDSRIEAHAEINSLSHSCSKEIVPEKSRGGRNFREILMFHFKASGEGWFGCRNIRFINKSGLKDDEIFIPPGFIKSFRREFYSKLNELLEYPDNEPVTASQKETAPVPLNYVPRTKLIPPHSSPVPFVLFSKKFKEKNLPVFNGKTFIPLMPVLFDPDSYLESLNRTLDSNSSREYVLGLNSVTHLAWTEKLAERDNVSFFIDYGLYVANSETCSYYRNKVPKLEFCYFWIEGSEDDYRRIKNSMSPSEPPLFFIEKDFRPHLFISRACHTNNINGGRCPSGCPREFRYTLKQNKRVFTVIVEDCMTWLFDGS